MAKALRESKKLEAPVTLFAAIEAKQHEFLRTLAFKERRSLADLVREALADFQRKKERERKTCGERLDR
jgi:uncharacterized membrane protein